MEDKNMTSEAALEQRIGEWRTFFSKRQAVHSADVAELEDHLRSQVDALRAAGLDEDEAFLVAVKRLGSLDAVSREFASEYSERMWKQLVVLPAADAAPANKHATTAIALAIAAALAMKLPELFGMKFGDNSTDMFYVHNIPFFVLPFLAAFFAMKRRVRGVEWLWMLLPFVAAAIVVNVLPFTDRGFTEHLSIIHMPFALWLVVGFAYVGGQWRAHQQRMNFVRFSGEWFIYYVLIALGGGALIGVTVFIFNAIGLKAEPAVQRWIVPCGAAGAVIIGAWLVEAKQSVIENMAPVLTMLFTPLFTILLLVFVGAMIVTGNAIDVSREVLIGFDLLLVVVSALLLYRISARDPQEAPGRFDRLQFLLVISALVVDVLALWAIVARISEFGWSPNKTAALGLNILLLANLGGLALHYARFIWKRASFVLVERWQTAYLPVFGLWAAFVAVLFPVIFRYQ
jgi:hypothetical protein